MSRLLFAAARGARIEVMDCEGCWVPKTQWGFSPLGDYRIHPDDEHLQYGPISSACQNEAQSPDRYYYRPMSEELRYALRDWLPGFDFTEYDLMASELHRSLFLLFLAEALADEGL